MLLGSTLHEVSWHTSGLWRRLRQAAQRQEKGVALPESCEIHQSWSPARALRRGLFWQSLRALPVARLPASWQPSELSKLSKVHIGSLESFGWDREAPWLKRSARHRRKEALPATLQSCEPWHKLTQVSTSYAGDAFKGLAHQNS